MGVIGSAFVALKDGRSGVACMAWRARRSAGIAVIAVGCLDVSPIRLALLYL
jgi:hypothetical protein